jgi:DNA topoisomerase-1
MNVVIVESPAKAKTINKYLGSNYQVIASYGHIRDLPSKEGSVEPENNFHMHYDLNESGVKRLKEIAETVKNADTIYLATDPDREGESISWHIIEALKEKKKLKKSTIIKRVVFHEITKKAVIEAIQNPREIDTNLVNAQQARRALDYLVGFNLSPILWRKLPGSKSAGRVQSVALKLICEREHQIEIFVSEEYWDIKARLETAKKEEFTATLTHIDNHKLEKLSIKNATQAQEYIKKISKTTLQLKDLIYKELKRYPAPPFTTSSMQQEAARKLGLSAKQTMLIAQKLYEGIEMDNETVGLITYMRTDSVNLSDEAVKTIREIIGKNYGSEYVPKAAPQYKTKLKNAQEAHEAIRPTNVNLMPSKVKQYLDDKQYKLYELIWKRSVACQMENAVIDQGIAIIDSINGDIKFRATGSRIKFDGFYKLYKEGLDDEAEEEHSLLPFMQIGETLNVKKLEPNQHFTEAPPRYSEASLIKKLEELGIGRPSTYAPIISVLQEREYVKIDNKRLVPEERGRLVTAFLISFFTQYVEYDFTANLENQLDDISSGHLEWREMLSQFWQKFYSNVESVKELEITKVLDALNEVLKDHLFPMTKDGSDPAQCPACKGDLSLKLGKFGAFISCSNYPECKYTRQIGDSDSEGETNILEDSKILGKFPATEDNILLKKGPYGFYLQLGEDEKGKKPKRVTIPKGSSIESITLDKAISLLSLPREIGVHPSTGKVVKASIGPYGPYLLHDSKFTSLPASEDILSIGINRAISIIEEKSSSANSVLKDFNTHPKTNIPIQILKGRFGPYIKYGAQNIKIPKDMSVEEINLETILNIIKDNIKDSDKSTKKAKKKK